jgi:hypothetical protein
VVGRLRESGLGNHPVAIVRALSISVLPCVLFGCEIWAIEWLWDVVFAGTSPFRCTTLEPILHFLKKQLHVSLRTPDAFIHRLFNLPSMLKLILSRFNKLCRLIS